MAHHAQIDARAAPKGRRQSVPPPAPDRLAGPLDIREGDCRAVLPTLPSESVHLVLTDPPYFLDGLDDAWRKGGPHSVRATGSVGGLPVGMKFDAKQGRAFQAFMEPIAQELVRVLVPGGFFLSFSQPRLVHRLAVAAEDAGFEIRDMYAWHYTKKAQFKAFSMDHFVRRMALPEVEKDMMLREMRGRKTPQLRPQFEAIVVAMKPRQGSFVQNWQHHRTGLIDATQTLDGGAPTTVMCVEKPVRDSFNTHLAVKPVRLLSHLIKLFTCPQQVVLDPFLGSGSTALAALRAERHCVGIEINPDYVAIAKRRAKESQP